MRASQLDVEGVSPAEILSMQREDQDALLAFERPLTFRMGTSTILAEFGVEDDVMTVNLGHIDGGGEGVLLQLWKAIETFAAQRGFRQVQWNVFAATCAKPNPRLQRFLKANGFTLIDHPKHGQIYNRLVARRQG